MKRLLPLCTLAAGLYGGLLAVAAAQALPPPPPLPPAYVAPGSPQYSRDGNPDNRRGTWRNLPPEQREAIRRLSEQERQALASRGTNRSGEAAPPGGRLSLEERRQLRAQIREEHERRGPRSGGGKRP